MTPYCINYKNLIKCGVFYCWGLYSWVMGKEFYSETPRMMPNCIPQVFVFVEFYGEKLRIAPNRIPRKMVTP